MDLFDVVIIGAGIFGIQAARTYLDIHPECNIILLESDTVAGGVWSKSRSYPNFWSQSGYGMASFSDRPFTKPDSAVHNLFEAKYITDYLEEYIDNHVYSGRSLRSRIRYGWSVTSATKSSDGSWLITGNATKVNDRFALCTKKLIVASGSTSIPRAPKIKNENFLGRTVHLIDFAAECRKGLLSGPPKHICILGAGKSAADMAYEAAKSGNAVSWIIRKNGHGPGLFATPKKIGSFENPGEIAATRLMGTLSPSFLAEDTAWMRFLHATRLGRWLVGRIFHIAEVDQFKAAGYDREDRKRNGFETLKPVARAFWINAAVGMIQLSDFWDLIAEHVKVYRDEISYLSTSKVHLAEGDEIPCDLLLLGTGFQHEYPFFDRRQQVELGLSHPRQANDMEAEWDAMTVNADRVLLTRFPILRESPGFIPKPDMTPFRLYNAMAPLSDPSIVFVGCVSLLSMFLGAEIQALWASAYLDGNVSHLPSLEVRKRQIAMDNQWSRRRYPYYSEISGTVYDFEIIKYFDRLLGELGLSSHIQKTWWGYWTGSNTTDVYRGVKDEYLAMLKKNI